MLRIVCVQQILLLALVAVLSAACATKQHYAWKLNGKTRAQFNDSWNTCTAEKNKAVNDQAGKGLANAMAFATMADGIFFRCMERNGFSYTKADKDSLEE